MEWSRHLWPVLRVHPARKELIERMRAQLCQTQYVSHVPKSYIRVPAPSYSAPLNLILILLLTIGRVLRRL